MSWPPLYKRGGFLCFLVNRRFRALRRNVKKCFLCLNLSHVYLILIIFFVDFILYNIYNLFPKFSFLFSFFLFFFLFVVLLNTL